MTIRSSIINLSSKILQPVNVVPRGAPKNVDKTQLSKSHKLMVDLGIIRVSSTGIYSLLPMGTRSLNKLRNIVKLEMSKLHAQEVKLPYLTESSLWKKSGRWKTDGLNIFMMKDRNNKDIILSPTNEEAAADLIASIPQISHHQLPLLMYQISTKFRDEIKPRCGLLKSKEFEMKDLYSFDSTLENAKKTYERVSEAYRNIFGKLNLPVARVSADNGDMKGIYSNEFHICDNLGEDILINCKSCGHSFNSEQNEVTECENCKSNSISSLKGIEIGHTFLLGTVYSEPLNAMFKTPSGKLEPLVMASYGLGISRTLAAGVELLSSESEIRWPSLLAPFSVVIIGPKEGSKEYTSGKSLCEDLYLKLNSFPNLWNDVLFDDREDMTIGRRLLHSKKMGFPFIIIAGSKALEVPPLFEIHDTIQGSQKLVTYEEVIDLVTGNVPQESMPLMNAS